MRVSPFTALIISFASWLGIGVFLLYKGLRLLVELSPGVAHSSMLSFFSKMAGGMQQAVLLCICIGLFVGFMKGRFVLSKTVGRLSNRFFSYGRPMSLKEMYPAYYLALVGSMILLGMSLKWMPVPQEVRGTIDVAIGAALTNGAFQYLRVAFSKGRQVAVK